MIARLAGSALAFSFALLALIVPAHGQAVTIIHNFVATDGNNPNAGLTQSSNGTLYGTTENGGNNGQGALYQTDTLGNETILHSFLDPNVPSDGYAPVAPVIQAANGSFYGTTYFGGTDANGIVFQVTPQGQYTVLHNFGDSSTPNDGMKPQDRVIQGADGNFYGTATLGGSTLNEPNGGGVVFQMTPAGGITILHAFADGSVANDGINPIGGLVQGPDGTLYGATPATILSGTSGCVFSITPGGQYTVLHRFGDGTVPGDGGYPNGDLVQGADGNFYGTTQKGGNGNGTVFKITPQGQVTILHTFLDGSVLNDGGFPTSGLMLGSDGNFYGQTSAGGSNGAGTIFEITPQGVVTILHSFMDGTVTNDGFQTALTPTGQLIQGSDGNLYGATRDGGSFEYGTVFQVRLGVPAMLSPVTTSGTANVPFVFPTVATNSPTSYSATAMPPGLSINSTTGVITGTPTTAGTYYPALTFTNSAGSNQATLVITINSAQVSSLTSAPAVYGTVGTAFTYATTASNIPTAFAAIGSSPVLPPGLSIDPNTGIISGTPTTSGIYSVTLQFTNAQGTNTASLIIEIGPGPTSPYFEYEYNVLHVFGQGTPQYDSGGASAFLQAFDGSFWGVSYDGGTLGSGTLFTMTAAGTETIVDSLGNSYAASGVPMAPTSLIQGSDGNFYAVSTDAATNTPTLSRISPQGYQTLLCNLGSAGNYPPAGSLVQGADGNFYGTMSAYGSGPTETYGAIYKVTPQGVLTVLHHFGDNSVPNDGLNPKSALIQATDGNFYGTTAGGGSDGAGTAYKITPLGVVTILHSFEAGMVSDLQGNQVDDGLVPIGGLIQGSDGNFYGTTELGGAFSQGTVFRMTPQGVVTLLHAFNNDYVIGDGQIGDGQYPGTGLLEGYDGNFYGTTLGDGEGGYGTVFRITPQGVVTILHYFSGETDGQAPEATSPLIQGTDGNIYGISSDTVFSVLASRSPTQKPVFSGAAYATSPLGTPLSFTPKAQFGVSGSAAGANFVKAAAGIHPDTTPTNWTLTGSLPSLLSFDSTTGAISGIPLVSGRFTVTLTPNNSVGSGTPTSVTLYIDVPPNITSARNAAANATDSFSYTITGDALPTGFDATKLPGWLSLDPTTGLLTGSPPTGGTYAFNVAAENFAGVGTQQVVLSVTGDAPGSPVITSATTATATAGSAFTYQITASNSPTTFTALTLPVGLTFNAQTGTISGTPTTAGTYSIPISAANTAGATASEVTITVGIAGAPVLNGPLSATAIVNTAFTYQVPATGLVATYSALGLPSGLTIDPASGIISGTPTGAGTTPVTVLATNGSGAAQTTLSLTVASETGSVQVTLSPDDANNNGAQWSVDGGAFQSSGATVSGLGVGPHTLTFSPVGGYTTPASQSISVTANSTATASATYTTVPATGSLQVTLGPSAAVGAGALWSVDGGATQSSGATVSGLSVGSHTVTFTSTLGYTTPASQMVMVSANQTATASATYVPATGSLKVTLSPSGAVTAGAQWSVDDGPLQNSGATVSGLGVGSHSVVFTSVTGYTAPASQMVTVSANTTASATGAYPATPTGSLQVTLVPSSAVSIGAQWEVDGGPLQNSGSTVGGLSVGSHTVVFNSVLGFLTPASQSVSVAANKTTAATGTYGESQTPEITSPLAYTGFSTLSFTYQATASHSPTKFYATGLPKGATLNATTGAITCKSVAVGTYPVTLSASNANGTGDPSTLTLTIVAAPPTVATAAASSITAQTATLNGTVNPKGGDTMASFQYGLTTAYGSATTAQDMGVGTANVTFHAGLTGLAPATAYHFRAVALKEGGYLYGADETFKTLAEPVIATNPVTPLLSAFGAQVGFAVNPNGLATTAYIKYSTDPSFGTFSQSATQSIGNGKVAVNVTAFLSGLQPNTTYYYEVVTMSAAGTFHSSEESFTTLGFDITQVAATGQSAPGTVFNFASFDSAAIDSLDGAAFYAKTSSTSTTSNAGIWANQGSSALSLIAQTGSTAPGTGGAVFATLGDPVYNDNEDVAFGGMLKVATGLVTTSNENGVWTSNAFTLGLIAREGGIAPGAGTATFSTFGSVGLTDSAGALFSATLATGTATGVTTANNEGVWEGATAGALTLMLRNGETTDTSKTIASFKFLPTETYVNGQTRGFGPTTGHLVANATYTDSSTDTGIIKVTTPASPTAVATSGDAAIGTTGATFATFSTPAINDSDDTAFAATLTVGVGDAVKANAGGIWADNAGTRALVARLGQVAPGLTTNATFTAFSDPVYNDSDAVAFRATLGTGTGQATTATASGIWTDSSGSLALAAQQGTQAPGCATGVNFLAFTELALDDVNGGGVIFLATLSGTGVTTANNTAIFAVDNTGTLQLIVRTGDLLNGKTITALTFLPAETLVNGQTRSFSPSTGDLVYNATFSDKSQAIFNVVFP